MIFAAQFVDLGGNRITECLYDAGTASSTLIREYNWMNGAPALSQSAICR